MSSPGSGRFGLPAWLVLTGLVIETVSLLRSHPLTFTLFLVGGLVTATGCCLYLWRMVSGEPSDGARNDGARG